MLAIFIVKMQILTTVIPLFFVLMNCRWKVSKVIFFNLLTYFGACLYGGGGPQIGEVTCGGSPHLTRKLDQIKMRDWMDGRVTQSKRVTSPKTGVPHLHVNRPLLWYLLQLISRPIWWKYASCKAYICVWWNVCRTMQRWKSTGKRPDLKESFFLCLWTW